MDEGRKRLLIASAILAARELSSFDGGKRVPATVSAISDAVRWAEELLKAIDERWPAAGASKRWPHYTERFYDPLCKKFRP